MLGEKWDTHRRDHPLLLAWQQIVHLIPMGLHNKCVELFHFAQVLVPAHRRRMPCADPTLLCFYVGEARRGGVLTQLSTCGVLINTGGLPSSTTGGQCHVSCTGCFC